MMVSEPSSRIPPRTFSLRPLITAVTVITVVMPITIPRIVSAERSLFFRKVSRARSTSSQSLRTPSFRFRAGRGSAVTLGRVFSKVLIRPFSHSDRSASTGSSFAAFEAGYVPKKRPTLKATSSPPMTDQSCTALGRGETQVVPPAHNLADFIHAFLNFRSGAGARGDAQGILLIAEVLFISGEGDDDPIVQRVSERGSLLFSS